MNHFVIVCVPVTSLKKKIPQRPLTVEYITNSFIERDLNQKEQGKNDAALHHQ